VAAMRRNRIERLDIGQDYKPITWGESQVVIKTSGLS
jgi:hypothetical protein